MRYLAILLVFTFTVGCGLSPTYSRHEAEGKTTPQLLKEYNVFSSQGMFTVSNPGELMGLPYPRAIKNELEIRGYKCNPTGCFHPDDFK